MSENISEEDKRKNDILDLMATFNAARANLIAPKISPTQQAVQNDMRLQSCAVYEVTKGLTLAIKDREPILAKFAEFKAMVKRGSMTLEQLEDSLAVRHGVVEESQVPTE